jgi:tetratricopeptide (TPR) repeat protein
MTEQELAHLAHWHFGVAYEHQVAGRTGDAVEAYRYSLALFPTVETYTRLAQVLGRLGRYEEAIQQRHAAGALNPDSGDAYNEIGRALIAMERWEAAQTWLS